MESIQNDKLGYIKTVYADLFRYKGKTDIITFMNTYFTILEFRYIFWLRTASKFKNTSLCKAFYCISRVILYRLKIKLGINIPYNTNIKPGFYIGHFGTIVVDHKVKIGWNCNISCGVILGFANRGKNIGVPEIGNNVYIGPGAKVIGKIKIGNNVAIGANCVVTKNISDNAVVVGVPGRIVSSKGSEGYVCNTVPLNGFLLGHY